eukprot:scaffold84536_cov26-Prasinocladus_malaysianus.AAC.2
MRENSALHNRQVRHCDIVFDQRGRKQSLPAQGFAFAGWAQKLPKQRISDWCKAVFHSGALQPRIQPFVMTHDNGGIWPTQTLGWFRAKISSFGWAIEAIVLVQSGDHIDVYELVADTHDSLSHGRYFKKQLKLKKRQCLVTGRDIVHQLDGLARPAAHTVR